MLEPVVDPEALVAQLPKLSDLHEALRCHICYDFYTAPVSLVCGHTFCSKCVRTYLDHQTANSATGACPDCREPCEPTSLRKNDSLRAAVAGFKNLLPVLQQLLMQHAEAVASVAAATAAAKAAATCAKVQHRHHIPSIQHEPTGTADSDEVCAQHAAPRHQRSSRAHLKRAASASQHANDTNSPSQPSNRPARLKPGAAITSPDIPPAPAAKRQRHTDKTTAPRQQVFNVDSDQESEDGEDINNAERHTGVAAGIQLNAQLQVQHQQQDRPKRLTAAPATAATVGQSRPVGPSDQEEDAIDVISPSVSMDGDGAGHDSDYDPNDMAEQVHSAHAQAVSCRASNRGSNSHARRTGGHTDTSHHDMQDEAVEDRGATAGEQPAVVHKLPPGYVNCPICSFSFRTKAIEAHAATCMGRSNNQAPPTHQPPRLATAAAAAPAITSAAAAGRPASSRAAPAQLLQVEDSRRGSSAPAKLGRKAASTKCMVEVPSKLVMHVLKDKELKGKLQALLLPTEGKRQELVDRYVRYRRFVQTEVDGGTTRDQAQLRYKFLQEEKRLAEARKITPRLEVAAPATFDELISQTRQRRHASTAAAASGSKDDETLPDGADAAAAAEGVADCRGIETDQQGCGVVEAQPEDFEADAVGQHDAAVGSDLVDDVPHEAADELPIVEEMEAGMDDEEMPDKVETAIEDAADQQHQQHSSMLGAQETSIQQVAEIATDDAHANVQLGSSQLVGKGLVPADMPQALTGL